MAVWGWTWLPRKSAVALVANETREESTTAPKESKRTAAPSHLVATFAISIRYIRYIHPGKACGGVPVQLYLELLSLVTRTSKVKEDLSPALMLRI